MTPRGRRGLRTWITAQLLLLLQMLALGASGRWASRAMACFTGHARLPGLSGSARHSVSPPPPTLIPLREGLMASLRGGEDELPHKPPSRARMPKFLVDVDADGKELSRRRKPPGRTPSGYVEAASGEWVRTVESVPMELSADDRSEEGNSWMSRSVLPTGNSLLGADSMLGMPRGPEGACPMGNMEPLDKRLWDPPPERWVVFSDLHVSRSTLSTCLAVLDLVHKEAKKRRAGVIFLGDFWHERGLLRVEPLNAVLRAMSSWEVPLLALPGNHDQTSLDGSTHSLTPLAFAVHSARIISEPTVLMGALWMPYRRQYGNLKQRMRELLPSPDTPPQSEQKQQGAGQEAEPSMLGAADASEVRAIFCHVDVIGADMGGGVLAERGMQVDDFPAHLPVYTGHYHKPHTVLGKVPREYPVRYVGSPYQTSMGEAGEDKALLVVNTATWQVSEEIPLTPHALGHRHFRATSMEMLMRELPGWGVRPGDRVQLRVEDAQAAKEQIAGIGADGVSFEIREERRDEEEARIPRADTLDALALFDLYFRQHNTSKVSEGAREMARSLLQEVVTTTPAASVTKRDIVFESIELRGYGSFGFENTVVYPLGDRGVVLVVGRNDDEESSDSNGSGKTTLCMAALWALTGSVDLRADGKSPTRKDVVHSTSAASNKTRMRKSAMASVVLRGIVNGESFSVSRTSNSAKSESHTLTVSHGGKDLTQQGVKETQEELERLLPVAVLGDAVFHGQHLVKGLLERTDKDFKSALDNIMPSEVWDAALESARVHKRKARIAKEELSGRIKEKEGELAPLEVAQEEAERKYAEWIRDRKAFLDSVRGELRGLLDEQVRKGLDVTQCKAESQAAQAEVLALQTRLEEMVAQGSEARRRLDEERRGAENAYFAARDAQARAVSVAQEGRARFGELERALERLHSCTERVGELSARQEEWAKGREREVAEASKRVQLAEERVKEAQAQQGQDFAESEIRRADALGERGRAEEEYEGAYGRYVDASRALEAARDRREKYAALQGNPTCPLCLQGVDAHTHAHNLEGLSAEEGGLYVRAKEAELAWKAATETRDGARARATQVESECVQAAGAGRECVLLAEGELNRAKDAAVCAEGGLWGEAAALEQARKSVGSCEAEVVVLKKAMWKVLEQHAGQEVGMGGWGGDTVMSDGHAEALRAALLRSEGAATQLSAEASRCESVRAGAVAKAAAYEQEVERASLFLRKDISSAREREQQCAVRVERSQAHNNTVWEVRKRIEREDGVVNPHQASLERCRLALESGQERVGLLRRDFQAWEAELARWWEVDELFGKKGLQSFVYEVAILELQRRAARYLERLSDDSLRLVLKLEDQVVQRTLLSRLSDGSYASRTLHQLSGGQWRRLGLALTLAFSECSLERTGTSCNLLVLDEVMQHLDSEGCARVGMLLEDMINKQETDFKTALVILQTSVGEEMGDTFDQVDVVIKKGDCSYVQSHDKVFY